MSPKALLANIGVLAEARGGVKKLREMILGLALHGRLSSRLSDDEPLSALLERIARTRRSKNHQHLKDASDTDSGSEDLPRLPDTWQWVAVGEIADCVLGKMLDKSKHTKGTPRPYLRNSNVRWNAFDLSDLLTMFFEDDELERYGVRTGDVLICEGGEPGRAAVWQDASTTMLIQKAIHRVRLFEGILPEWLVMNLRYDTWSGRLERYFTGATIKHFTGKAMESYRIRLAPVAEQRRVVARVSQLMLLCDELEAKQAKKQEAEAQLTHSALDALTSAEGPEEFSAAWRRVTDNFEIFFDRPERVEDLRKVILGLALHGRLVNQDGADEAVDTLLARISQHSKADTAPSRKSTAESGGEDEEQHALPGSWKWVPVGKIADCVLGKMLDKSKHTKGVLRPYLRNINVRWGAFDLSDLLSMYFEEDELERYGVRDGDVLICEGGEPGRSSVWRDASRTMLIQKAIHRVRLGGGIAPEWLVMNLRYDAWTGRLDRYFTGATIKHFTGQALTRYSIRLAPIAEQSRIIAKVDHLMVLCDALETKLRDAEKGAQRLAEAMTAAMVT